MLWLLLACTSISDEPVELYQPTVEDWTSPVSNVTSTTPTTSTLTTTVTTPTGSTTDVERGWRVHHGPQKTCADPSAREEARFDTHIFHAAHSMSEDMIGSGVVVADLFGDGRPAVLTTGEASLTLFRARTDQWVEVTRQAIEDPATVDAVGGSAADVDGDGDLDLFIVTEHKNRLLINHDGVFRDETDAWGLGIHELRSMSSSWADIDLDQDLDLVVGNYGDGPGNLHASELYLNEGDHFVDVSDWLPTEMQTAWVFMTAWYDVNQDTYPDLFSIHDFANLAPHSVLLMNNAGKSLTIDHACEFHQDARGGMGAAFGDTNRDGGLDIAQTLLDDVSFLPSAPSAASLSGWIWAFEQSEALGITIERDLGQQFGWGIEFGDLDNDGDLDLHGIFGDWAEMGPNEGPATDALWEQMSDGTFVDTGPIWGLDDPDNGRGMVMADLNRDGWLDVVKRELQNAEGIAHMARCGSQHWIGIRLSQPGTANHFAIGSTIDVWSGEDRQRRWIHAGSSSQFSGAPPEAHFGLGDQRTPDRVEVTWPDGTVTVHPFLRGDRWHHIERLP